jgi:hypothetical protein
MFINFTKWLFFAVIIAIATNNANSATIDVNGLEVGGSNYAFYDVSGVPWNGSLWGQPLALRPVIGTMHYDPERVKAQLTVMKSRGQKKISLILWHMNLGSGGGNDGVYMHTINSNGGALTPLHQDNLIKLLNYIKELKFEEVQLRVAPQGGNDPGSWPQGWNEPVYQENWNFIANTRKLVEDTLSSTQIRRTYDLGIELGGLTGGQIAEYTRRLWSDYSSSFGTADTCGFSIAVAPGRLPALIDNLRLTGKLPNFYALDIYGDEYKYLSMVHDELVAAGEANKGIDIQETYYNDSDSYYQIVSAKNKFGLKVRTVMQWPVQRGGPGWLNYTPEYRNYSPTSKSGSSAVINASTPLCTIASNSTYCSPTISWSTVPATDSNVNLSSGQLFAQGSSGTQAAPWIGPGEYSFLLSSNGYLRDKISVYGLPLKGKLLSSSSNNTCQLRPNENVCTLNIYWSVPDGWNENISVKVGGRLFAISGVNGTSSAPWISTDGDLFSLYAGSRLLDQIYVKAIR